MPFKLICDANGISIGAVLGQRKEGRYHVICYISKTLNPAQHNNSTTEKETLAVVCSFERLREYLICSKAVVFTDFSTLKFLITKKDAKPRLIRWVLLLQESHFELKDRKVSKNIVADHLSRLPEIL